MRRKSVTGEMMMGYIAQALLLLMREKPYAEITIGEITHRAGVNRSTYYRHFDTKESIVRFYFNTVMCEYRQAFSELQSMDFTLYLLTMFQTFYQHKEDLLLLHKEGLSIYLLDVLMAHFRFEEMAKGAPVEQQYRASYHLGGINNNLLLWFSHGMTESPKEMARIALSYRPAESLTLFNV